MGVNKLGQHGKRGHHKGKKAKPDKCQIKRDSLAREIMYAEINRKKVMEELEKHMEEVNKTEQKSEFESVVRYYEKIFDTKDMAINILWAELNDAETQQQANVRAHFDNMDKLIDQYMAILQDLKQNYINDLLILNKDSVKEEKCIRTYTGQNKQDLKMMQYGLVYDLKTFMEKDISRYVRFINEIKQKRKTERIQRMALYDYKAGECWKRLVAELETYQTNIKVKKSLYDACFAEDCAIRNEIDSNQVLLFRQTVIYRNLKDRVKEEESTYAARILFYEEDLKFFIHLRLKIQRHYLKNKKLDQRQIMLLVDESTKAQEHISQVRGKIDTLLRWYSLIRKHETHREKTLPYPPFLPDDHMYHKVITHKEFDGVLKQDRHHHLGLFFRTNYHHRAAQSDRTRYCLYEEKKFLLKQNQEIRKAIDTYKRYYNLPR